MSPSLKMRENWKESIPELINSATSTRGVKACPLSVGFVISITYIATGAVYFHDCPVQEMIPIYLIVMGGVLIISSLSACLPCTENPKGRLKKFLKFWVSLVSIFIFCWFIAGNYWIYSVFEPSYNKNGTDVSRYCNKTLYLFSFWTTTLLYMLLGFFLVTCCWCLCCMVVYCRNLLKPLCSQKQAEEKDETSNLSERETSQA